MTEDTDGSRRPAGGRLTWAVDPDRRVVTVFCRGGVADEDLLSVIPKIWEEHPDVIAYDTLVDARTLTSEGGWTWAALREIARQWRAFAQGRDHGRRTAIVTTDDWVARLVEAFALDYRGRRFRCFGDPERALAWARGS